MQHTASNAVTVKGRRPGPYTVTILLCLGWVFMYADRTVLSPITVEIGKEWGLDKAELGLMSTVFFITYTLMQIPTGIIADRVGRALTLAIGYAAFGVGTFLSGLAPGFMMFLLIRAFTGVGEGTFYGPAYGISGATISKRFRGLSSAVINSGQAIGISLGLTASSYVVFDLGLHWKSIFLIFGVATVAVTGLIYYFLRPLDRLSSQAAARNASAGKMGWRPLFTRNHVLIYVLMFCSCYGFFNVLTWLPTYLQEARGVAPSQTGIIASLVPWASIPGAVLFGLWSDRMKSKKALIVALALGAAACLVAIPAVGQFSLLVVFLVIYGLVGKLALDPVEISFMAENTPPEMYARSYSLFNFFAMASSVLAPYVTGYLADVTGQLAIGFYVSAALLLIGAAAFLFTKPARVAGSDPAALREPAPQMA
jgi:MFS family permease